MEKKPERDFLGKQSRYTADGNWEGLCYRISGKGSACSIPTGLDRHHGDNTTITSVSNRPKDCTPYEGNPSHAYGNVVELKGCASTFNTINNE